MPDTDFWIIGAQAFLAAQGLRVTQMINEGIPGAAASPQECIFCLLANWDCEACLVGQFVEETRGPFSPRRKMLMCMNLSEWCSLGRALKKGYTELAEVAFSDLEDVVTEGIEWLKVRNSTFGSETVK